MMNFSDETVSKVADVILDELSATQEGIAIDPKIVARAALSSLTLADLMPWQPIETAPKDGTEILIFDGQIFVAYWDSGTWEGGTWLSTACASSYYGTSDATHWMPLPNPPTEAK